MKSSAGSSKNALYILLGVQAILAFVLGIFGNKVADLINISSTSVLLGTVTMMVLSLAATIVISRREAKLATTDQLPLFPTPSLAEKTSRLLLNRIVTIFPLGIVVGTITGFTFVTVLPLLTLWDGVGISDVLFIYSYELISFIVALVTIFIVSRSRRDVSLILSYAFGFAVSIAGVIMMIHPEQNIFLYTFVGWALVLTLVSFVMRSRTVEALYSEITDIIQNLMRDRTS